MPQPAMIGVSMVCIRAPALRSAALAVDADAADGPVPARTSVPVPPHPHRTATSSTTHANRCSHSSTRTTNQYVSSGRRSIAVKADDICRCALGRSPFVHPGCDPLAGGPIACAIDAGCQEGNTSIATRGWSGCRHFDPMPLSLHCTGPLPNDFVTGCTLHQPAGHCSDYSVTANGLRQRMTDGGSSSASFGGRAGLARGIRFSVCLTHFPRSALFPRPQPPPSSIRMRLMRNHQVFVSPMVLGWSSGRRRCLNGRLDQLRRSERN